MGVGGEGRKKKQRESIYGHISKAMQRCGGENVQFGPKRI